MSQGQLAGADVLVIDDDLGMREMVREFLEEEGYAVRTARDGSEALQRIADRLPALVLLDLNMPVMDGYELHAHMHAQALGIPIIFMSAGERPQREAERLGADGWLAKPFTLDALLTLVSRWVAPTAEV